MTTLYIDPGLLCIVIGQTPGGGVAEALYMVVAQTTIRSRLRQGLSLLETLADVNRQLYDLDSKQSLCALVGTLNTADGRLSYVNAGQQQPFLMRNEERYEWMEAPVYAALGLNQNVSYRTMELRLKQGDRLLSRCFVKRGAAGRRKARRKPLPGPGPEPASGSERLREGTA